MGVMSEGLLAEKRLSLLLLLLFVSSHSRAQDFNWNLTTKSGEEYSRVALERLSNDTLYFLHASNYADWIVLDSVVQLRRERRGAILPATLIGSIGGGILGLALKPVARDQEEANVYSAAFGVVIGGVAGYLIGSTIQSDEVHELHQLDHQAKVDTLKRIMQ